jgi:hypothetical protein
MFAGKCQAAALDRWRIRLRYGKHTTREKEKNAAQDFSQRDAHFPIGRVGPDLNFTVSNRS